MQPAVENVLQRCQQPGPARPFFLKGVTTSLHAALFGKIVAVDGEQQNQRWAPQSLQLASDAKTIDIRQLDIKDDEIRLQLQRLTDRLRASGSLPHYGQAGFTQQ